MHKVDILMLNTWPSLYKQYKWLTCGLQAGQKKKNKLKKNKKKQQCYSRVSASYKAK